MLLDALTYLADGGMNKVGVASRAAGLQARFPMLDPYVAEYAWQEPMDSKSPRRTRQVVAAAGAVSIRAEGIDGSTQNGLFGAH